MKDAGAELVLGIVAPVGADLDQFVGALEDNVRRFRYTPQPVRLSGLLSKATGLKEQLAFGTEYERLTTHMNAGNELRSRTGVDEVLALWAVAAIRSQRAAPGQRQASTAWLIRSLKHPDEVRALRAVYGPGFYLIGVAVPEADRRWYLSQKGLSETQIAEVINRDKAEDDPHGQQMRDAFELADVYIQQHRDTHATGQQIDRFLKLIFGKVVETPTPDEHAMFLAYASSTRSGDLSRQVGAVIAREGVGVIATGCNDVPAAGGGLYCMDDRDARDHVLGHDANQRQKDDIAADVARHVLHALRKHGALKDPQSKLESVIEGACRDSRLLDITEYGRPVHAEMDALLTCARAGTSTRGATLYSTTFPCHNCAKHVVAAGIRRVVYVEPYEKSQAVQLHGDAIRTVDSSEPPTDRVLFEPFVGVGPRRFLDLFAMRLGDGYPMKRKLEGAVAPWDATNAVVRVSLLPTSYLDREAQFATITNSLIDTLEKA